MSNTLFSKIALSLSGGGYRATAFHLGTLSLLNHIQFTQPDGTISPLLDRVKALSTISGGTFTGVMWAYHNSQGQPFEVCFNKLYGLLETEDLVESAFAKLKGKRRWTNPNKTKKLINAFAEVYNDDFFNQADFAALIGKDSQLTIDSISFNATEFRYGLAFRFQNQGLFGNHYLQLDRDQMGEIKLGDIVASSSCFPGGFEPLVFPNDYQQSKDGPLASNWKKTTRSTDPIAIMDGGIIDNQGIDSIVFAEDRLEKSQQWNATDSTIDTFIASDVEGKTMNPYEVPRPDADTSKRSINSLRTILWIVFLLSSGLFLAASYMVIDQSITGWILGVALGAILGAASLALNLAIGKMQRMVGTSLQSVVSQSETDIKQELGVLFNAPLPILKSLIQLRITSVLTMVNDVFLKRIRRLQYARLYSDDSPWKDKMIANFIYSLLDKRYKLRDGSSKYQLSDQAYKLIKQARSMPTTLWFSKQEKKDKMLDSLIISGQMTICFKLIRHLNKKRRLADYTLRYQEQLADIDNLQKELEACWRRFNKEPQWLLEEVSKKP
ncbi:MAG: patatin-like phospholipase family protein [Bacteroidota bacterium]